MPAKSTSWGRQKSRSIQYYEADGLTVLKVIGLSQGVLPFSRENAIVYRLAPGGTQRTEISVPVRAILKHHAAIFHCMPATFSIYPTMR